MIVGDDDTDGATPLDPDDRDGLIPDHLATRTELNAWEQANIARAAAWVRARRRRTPLSIAFVQTLHRRMFDETWTWAGAFRRRDTNIGVPWTSIPVALRSLVEDATYWFEHGTYEVDEAAARLHHRLVWIHPFPNGNGRHARLFVDVVLAARRHTPFTWGRSDLQDAGAVRQRYIAALRAADQGDFTSLFAFVRS